MLGRTVGLLLVVACGPVTETVAPDAAPDAPPEPQTIGQVMSGLEVPASTSRAAELALDLDGDGAGDNALGSAFATASDLIELQSSVDQAIAGGVMLSLIELRTIDLMDATDVRVRGFVGADGDDPPDPEDNFSGTETFRIVPGSPTNSELPGVITGGELSAGPGPFPITVALPDTQPILLDLQGARMVATVEADGQLALGRLGGGVTEQQIDQVVIPALAATYQAIVDRDCPGNQCISGSDGETIRDLFDSDNDGQISPAELRNSDALGALLAPDLDLFDETGAFNPGKDGVDETTSMAVGFTATGATFAAP